MRVFSCLAGAFALLCATADAGAQYPGEIRGDVVDVLSGRPVPSADVRLSGAPGGAVTDATGLFRIRGLEPGSHFVEVRAPGYAPGRREVAVANGVATVVHFELVPEAMEVAGLVARVDAVAPGARSLTGAALRAGGATTVGALAAALPGVTVESRGRGGSQVPSIRASGGDAVLVLVDGVAINDPVTGEADLSTLPASGVTAVHVLPGGRSARFGARASGGVILVETGGGERPGRAIGVSVGSLGAWSADGSWVSAVSGGSLEMGAGAGGSDGRFEFQIPDQAGGGRATRRNAGVRSAHGRVLWTGVGHAWSYRVGVAAEGLGRGLPGRSYAPSLTGEQDLRRGRLSASMDWAPAGRWSFTADGHAFLQSMDHRDPMPPFGDPYDDRTVLRGGGGELGASWRPRAGVRIGGGVDVRHLNVRSSQLAEGSGVVHRTDTGVRMSGSVQGPEGTSLSAALGADRSGFPAATYVSHDVALAWVHGRGVHARLGHRSSFSPPTLGDQFFREGVGVQPNPDLGPERVPSEWTVGVGWEGRVSRIHTSLDVEAYRGDIRGMILWLPDFRFVWSPQNRDVRRHGAELVATVGGVREPWELRGHVSWNRATYLRPGMEDTQVVYRPEHAGGLVASWAADRWRASVSTALVGARYPVPNRVNRLPAFWTTDLNVSRTWRSTLGTLEVGLQVERVFDQRDALIFAYPDPGRTARLSARIQF